MGYKQDIINVAVVITIDVIIIDITIDIIIDIATAEVQIRPPYRSQSHRLWWQP